jgi:amino acid transporter
MSEEVKDAGRYVPVAIAWGYFSNGIMAAILLVTFLFSLPSVEDALNDNTGFPFIYAFKNATSMAGVNGLTSIILLPVIFSNILFNASTSRQTFAFARSKASHSRQRHRSIVHLQLCAFSYQHRILNGLQCYHLA